MLKKSYVKPAQSKNVQVLHIFWFKIYINHKSMKIRRQNIQKEVVNFMNMNKNDNETLKSYLRYDIINTVAE